ncbi:WXG100 family type VII secretion target [Streptomyces kasugaensis]|uniref:WXG100 family type VII secretion target n=1 Tax=Streptomyces kasugaensis TaxID=1946 RepID=A0A4Q9HN54_STRKA|nr:WXG100 family type VII secretion target [Streptomyces kasugaensis]TBO56283.1 WXG100 family type VII secretion target [Streptomyces kasugaensis]
MSGFKAPPQDDFHAYAGLTAKQSDHLSKLSRWSSTQCAHIDGLDGLLLLLREVVPETSHFFSGKLDQCGRGMGVIEDKIHRTSADYAKADHQAMADLHAIYPGALSHFPDIGAVPGSSRAGNFTDEDVTLKEPAGADADTEKNIHHQLLLLGRNSELRGADKVFMFCTGQSLVELLVKPIVGNYGRLRYLHDAYDALGDGTYTVAGTLRKGSWALGSEWQGDTATAFDSYLFRWTMGIGRVGDAAKMTAKAYQVGYDAIVVLVQSALREINNLINNEIKQLAEQAGEMLAGDAAIEAAGLGPEDPLADIGAGIYSAYKLYKIYKIVRRIVTVVTVIEKIYEGIAKAVQTIASEAEKVTAALESPMPSVGSLIDDVEQRGFTFEKGGGWSPTLGAARIGMLPSA